MNKRVLIIGPSPVKSKGGMATVTQEMLESEVLNSDFDLGVHESYRDGNLFYRILFSIYGFIKFLFIYNKYDIFHIHMAAYGSVFRKGLYVNFLKGKNKRIILHIHGAEYLVFYNKLSENKKLKVKKIWENADKIIVLSEKWKQDFFKIFKLENIVVINNGINIKKLKLAISKTEEKQNNFLLLGRLGKRKGAYDLIKAIEILKEEFLQVKLYMAGDGKIEEIKKIVKDRKLEENIEVVGWADFNKKIELLREVSTIVLPSYNEGLPMTILEGMATGKFIISTNVGGIPEVVINNENGIIIEPGDIQGLANAMKKVLTDIEFIKKCSENNIRKIKESFSMEKMHNEIKKIYV
ncbi:MAG: glycosyltransferase family 4 protein [Fusobacterium sp.]|uniref:glycosyltransferase family 4 protein n=1 Tax=Fusobacterium sp. TaxID=68766 RepID=UPI0029422C3E|nr:glycosyltransferase family 4 protein [Fusobacterium sp.]MDY3059065.1 glycosyltransferase family 4 protein [Fusobacterium sp.]